MSSNRRRLAAATALFAVVFATAGLSVVDAQSMLVAVGQSATVTTGRTIDIALAATGGDPGSTALVVETPPLHGTLTGTPPLVTYAPNAGHTGSDFFTFRAVDVSQTSEPAVVDLFVAADHARGRVQIVGNNLRTDTGGPIRGEALAFGPWNLTKMYDLDWWTELRDVFHLNTIRLFMYRPPQNYSGGPGSACAQCLDLDQTINGSLTTLEVLDDMVDIGRDLGMYVLIDYHPVGGHDVADAIAWWSVVAPRYRDETHVIYEMANEPVAWSPSQYTAADVQFEEDLFALIRAAAPDTHIIMWTFAHMTDDMKETADEGPSIQYDNASVGFHAYLDDVAGALELRGSYPAIQTEIGSTLGTGDPHETLVERTAYHEANGFSWVWLNGGFTTGATGAPTEGHLPSEVTWPPDPDAVSFVPDSTPPTTPTNPTVIAATGLEVGIEWDASEDPESGVLNYRVYRDGQLIGIPTAPTFQDTAVEPDTNYDYAVAAINGHGVESTAVSVFVSTAPPCPPVPLGDLVCGTSGLDLMIQWSLTGFFEEIVLVVSGTGDSTTVLSPDTVSYTFAGLPPGTYTVEVVGSCAGLPTAAPATCTVDHAPPLYRRGDVNSDGTVDIADAISLLAYLFAGAASPSCRDAANANDDGNLDIGDTLYLLSYLHTFGAPPMAPFPSCGLESATLGCILYTGCP